MTLHSQESAPETNSGRFRTLSGGYAICVAARHEVHDFVICEAFYMQSRNREIPPNTGCRSVSVEKGGGVG